MTRSFFLVLGLFSVFRLEAQTIRLEEPVRYLALGDSYTIGQSVAAEERWPAQLADSLEERAIEVETLRIIATTGWTTGNLLNAISGEGLADEGYNLVSLLIGVNNQYQGIPLSVYPQQFSQLMDSCLRYAGGDPSRVFVVSIPDYAYTPFGQSANPGQISQQLDVYNAINDSIASAYKVAYFNITPISRQGLSEPGLVASDGLHPSGEQYRRWVELILAHIDSAAATAVRAIPAPVMLELSPVPARGQVSFSMPRSADRWSLLDESGRELRKGRVTGAANQTISLTGLPAGSYHLRLLDAGRLVARGRVLVQ